MPGKNIPYLFFLLLLILISACNQNDDQRDFERSAFSSPDDAYTQTSANGEIISEDPDDWRVSPFYQGLVNIEPAFPNGAGSSDKISINLDNHGFESVSGLIVWAYYSDSADGLRLLDERSGELHPGLTTISFQGIQVARFPENPQGLYRVIILDGNENVISYGDVRIE